jgi:arginine decarboxylase
LPNPGQELRVRSEQLDLWSPQESARLYRIEEWGGGYFGVTSEGTVAVYPDADPSRAIDLYDVARGLAARDLTPPIIVRFPEILRHRMAHIRKAFDGAASELGYGGSYCCLYPIKVNQERHVCEAIRTFGHELGFGLEVGSKPELLAGLALTKGMNGMPLVCNGSSSRRPPRRTTSVRATAFGRSSRPPG